MNSGSLRVRLLLVGTISILAAVGLSGVGLSFLFERHVERRIVAELSLYLDQIIAGVGYADGELTLNLTLADPRFAEPLSGLYWQVETPHSILRSRSLWDAKLEMSAGVPLNGGVRSRKFPGPHGGDLIAVERRVALPARLGAGNMLAVVASDTEQIARATRNFTADLLPYLVLLGLFLITAAYVQVTIGLRPLADVRKRLAAIRVGTARRLGSAFPQEILPLASEVDGLLDGRETQLTKARARAADLAHGLKTPLQVLSGDIERLRQKGETGIADQIEQVATTMRRHVDRELARARMGASTSNPCAPVADVVNKVVAVASRTPAGAKLEWTVNIPAGLEARIDPNDLAEAIGNLAENAARYARGSVSIDSRRAGERIAITVTDDGPGIPSELISEALVRGGLFDRTGSGAGLGLAIVRDIADAWDGDIEMRKGETGFTAEFSVRA